MNNFYRVIAISFRHRFTVAASLFCSLAVAVLWGGNITAIYPVVDIIMNNKSIPQYLDEQKVLAEKRIAEVTPQIDEHKTQLQTATGDEQAKLNRELGSLTDELARKQKELGRYIKWNPVAHEYLPTTAFSTLCWVCTGLVIG